MIQEGTSFLKPEHDVPGDDQSWIEQLVDKSFFKFFPQLQDKILELGQISNFPAGHKFFKADEKMHSLFVPLNRPLSLRFTSGRFGEEKVFSNIKPFHAVGCHEAINGSVFPFAIEVDDPTYVFSIGKEDLLECFKNPEELKILDLICSSQALFSFSSWLLEEGIALASVRKILLSIKEKTQFEKLKEMRIKKVALFLIENGSVQITKKVGEDEIRVFLETGDWFGGSLIQPDNELKLDFHVVDDLSVQMVDFDILKPLVNGETFRTLCQEPCVQKEILKTQDFTYSAHTNVNDFETHDIANLANFGFRFKFKKLHFSNDLSQWTYATMWNSFLMLDFEINERQAQALSVGKSAMSFGTYAQLFEDLGFMTQIVRFKTDQWPEISVPHLAVIRGRPCLIIANKARHIWVLDPQKRLITYESKDIFQIWNRVSLRISRPHAQLALSHDLKSVNAKPEVTGKILLNYFLNQSKGELRNLAIFKFFQAIAVLFIPSFLLGLINQVVTYKRVDFLTMYYGGLGIFIIFQMFALYYSSIYTNQVLVNFKMKVQPYFYKLFLSQPNSFVSSVKAGFIQSRLSLVDFALAGLKAFRIDLVQSMISLSLFIFIVGFYSWQAAIVLLLFIAGGLGHAYLMREAGSLDIINTAQQRQEVTDLGLSFLTGFDSIKSTRSEKWAKSVFEKVFIALLKGSKSYNANIIKQTQTGTLIFQIGAVVTLYVVISELLYTQAPPQNALALSMYLSYCQGPYSSLLNLLVTYKISGVLGIPGQMVKNEIKESIATMKVVSLKGAVQLDRVSARYGDRGPYSVQDVTFSVQPREVVAIVGRSGSGKTTLGRVLSRQMELAGGRLMFDEIDVRTIDSSCIQSNIGFVSQTPTLFSGTIAQNIAVSDDILDERLVKEAALAANAHQFIEKLPGKYNYILREEGKGLSLGQRQQVALARVLYSRPKILILDEATAHLDPLAEKLISDRLFDFHKGQTVFVIVQRISTARKADKIVVMKNGRVVEVGDHNKLLAMNGEYAELFRHQVGADG